MTFKASARDMGLAVRDFIEGCDLFVYEDDPTGELWQKARREVTHVDASDAHNLIVFLDNGQRFRVSIAED